MRNYEELNKKRLWIKAKCLQAGPGKFRNTVIEQCRKDKVFWFDNFAYTYDPRVVPSNLPFILYHKQVRLIKFLDKLLKRTRRGEKVNLIADKPRDVGASFVLMGWCLWHYLFDEFVARVGSRKEDYVDKRGETDTLFFKLDYIMDRLPNWMKQGLGVEKWKDHRSYLMFGHPQNDNAVSGESANPNFGRGGRKSITIFDEFAFWQWARSSWESSGESTNLRLAVSTPPETGRDSHFYKLLIGEGGQIKKFSFEWTDVPGRNKEWLARQKTHKSDEEFNREVLKSFEGTTRGKVYAADFRHSEFLDCDYDPKLPLFVSWDFGLDQTAMLWLQKDFETNWVNIIDSYHNSNQSVDFYVPMVKGKIKSGVHQYSEEDLKIIDRHKKWKGATHYGDPDVKKRNRADKQSLRDILEKDGVYVQTYDRKIEDHLSIREKTKMLFRRLSVNEKRCEYFIDCIRNARYPQRIEGSQTTAEVVKPIHDWTSHFRTALEYFVDNEPEREGLDSEGFVDGDVPTRDIETIPTITRKDGFVSAREAEVVPEQEKDWRYL